MALFRTVCPNSIGFKKRGISRVGRAIAWKDYSARGQTRPLANSDRPPARRLGVFLGASLEGLTYINVGIASAALSGVMSVWFCRLTDPKSSRQQLIVIVVGLAMISLTLLGCFGFLFLANSAPVQELGYLVRLSVRILGVGLCLLAFNYGSQRICARFQVPLRDKARAKG